MFTRSTEKLIKCQCCVHYLFLSPPSGKKNCFAGLIQSIQSNRLLLRCNLGTVYNWSSPRHNIHQCWELILYQLWVVCFIFAKALQQDARMCKKNKKQKTKTLWLHHLPHHDTSTHAISNPPVFIPCRMYAFTFASFLVSFNTLYIVKSSSSSSPSKRLSLHLSSFSCPDVTLSSQWWVLNSPDGTVISTDVRFQRHGEEGKARGRSEHSTWWQVVSETHSHALTPLVSMRWSDAWRTVQRYSDIWAGIVFL